MAFRAPLLAPVPRRAELLLEFSVADVLARKTPPFYDVRGGGVPRLVIPAGLQTRSGSDSLDDLLGCAGTAHAGI